MRKIPICFAGIFALLLSIVLVACKANTDKADNVGSTTTQIQSGSYYSSYSYEEVSSRESSGGSSLSSKNTSSSKNKPAKSSSKKTVSFLPEPVTTNTVVISENKVIQTIKNQDSTQVFTYVFENNKVAACHYKATCTSEEEAKRIYDNFYGTNRFTKMYENLKRDGKVVTADYSKELLKEYATYTPSSLKTYLEHNTF